MHVTFRIKVDILAGDYLLARASILMALLRDVAVLNIMNGFIKHLVRERLYR